MRNSKLVKIVTEFNFAIETKVHGKYEVYKFGRKKTEVYTVQSFYLKDSKVYFIDLAGKHILFNNVSVFSFGKFDYVLPTYDWDRYK